MSYQFIISTCHMYDTNFPQNMFVTYQIKSQTSGDTLHYEIEHFTDMTPTSCHGPRMAMLGTRASRVVLLLLIFSTSVQEKFVCPVHKILYQ